MARPLVVSNPKIVMDFNGGVNGWSESHFYTSVVPLNNPGLQAAALALCTARCKALDGVNAKLFAARVSLDDVNRDSAQVDISGIVPDPTKGYFSIGGPDPSSTGTWSYQTVQVSWPIVLETLNPTTNPIEYIAGMPASTKQFGAFPYQDLPPKVSSYLEQYLIELTNGKWGALGRDWTSSTYNVSGTQFVAAAGATPAQLKFTFAAPIPGANIFPAGVYCRLADSVYTTPQKRLRLNGTYTVAAYDSVGGVLTVNVPRLIVAPTWTAFGSVQSADGAVFPYTNGVLRPITHRKRGRPFGGGRGRR